MKKRYSIRPSRGAQKLSRLLCIPYCLMSGFFVFIGVTRLIPSGAGVFGLVWTGMAAVFFCTGLYGLLSKKGLGHYRGFDVVAEEDDPADASACGDTEPQADGSLPSGDTARRLEELKTLLDAGLISRQEYAEKRKEILSRI